MAERHAFLSHRPTARSGGAPGSPMRFVLVTLLSCLFLQRFALPVAGLKVSFATPIVLGFAGWELHTRRLGLDRIRLGLLLALLAVALMSIAVQVDAPVNLVTRVSVPSLAYWLALTGFASLTFRIRVPEEEFYRLVNLCLGIIAAAGLLQFVAQFAGISVFAFSGIVPDSLLIEEQYALKNAVTGTDLLRSNGFFLVEASVFSQFMAVGLMVEVLYFRRPRFLALFLGGLLVSVSGTGWMVLCVFVVQLSLVSGLRGMLAALGITVLTGAAFAALLLLAPDVGAGFLKRSTEFTMQGTSGYERFVTPFLALRAVTDVAPHVWATGVGPGASEGLAVPFIYVINTPIKVLLEYGIGGLVLYIALFLSARRTPRQAALVLPLMVLLLFAGGYQQFSPVLFPVALLITVANLEEPRASPAREPPPPPAQARTQPLSRPV
ncbi:MAG: hypothetical protein ACRYGM_24665 [Janthinobacterium lividum]